MIADRRRFTIGLVLLAGFVVSMAMPELKRKPNNK